MPVVSLREAAAACGYRSPSTLHRLKKEGKLRQFESGRGLELRGLREHVAGLLRNDRRRPSELSGPPDLMESKARREAALADLAELELHEREGELVSVAEVKAELFRSCRQARDAILGITPRVIDELAAITSLNSDQRRQAELVINQELRRVCEHIAGIPSMGPNPQSNKEVF
ncbi:hypothetical protein [Cyanobium sp. Copco_Reservoir_LC18]|uniref:hypothetical protein n=1 Tax=Cyanobium sp. Copco_Reservoir_LC18 TaxID=1328305 RepID=UPI001358C732|nr:hypothetical protein [Cyanobium sp. Copco_Reservoir_LC18]